MAVEKEEVGRRVRLARKRKGLSQDQLGGLVGLGKSSVQRIERGQNEVGSITLARIAEAIGSSTDYLLGVESAGAAAAPEPEPESYEGAVNRVTSEVGKMAADVRVLLEMAGGSPLARTLVRCFAQTGRRVLAEVDGEPRPTRRGRKTSRSGGGAA